jgi:hypothetical protein
MMLETLLSGWSVARLVSRSYAFLCSLLGLTAVGAWVRGYERPSDALIAITEALHIPAPTAIGSVSAWVIHHGEVVALVAIGVVVVSMLWSASFVARNPYNFDKVRGPATFWFGATVVLEVGAGPALGYKLLPFVAPLALIIGTGIVLARWQRGREDSATEPRHSVSKTLAALLGGVVLALVMAPLSVLVGVGGMSSPGRSSATDTA